MFNKMLHEPKETIQLSLGNFYGNLVVVDWGNGKSYQLELDDCSSTQVRHISKELFDMMVKELG